MSQGESAVTEPQASADQAEPAEPLDEPDERDEPVAAAEPEVDAAEPEVDADEAFDGEGDDPGPEDDGTAAPGLTDIADLELEGEVIAKVIDEYATIGEPEPALDADTASDVLFSLCNLARWLRTPAEDALRGAIRRFERRFRHLESALEAQGRAPAQADAAELDRLWNEAKRAERVP